jgi:hypothetical protein
MDSSPYWLSIKSKPNATRMRKMLAGLKNRGKSAQKYGAE